MTKRIIVLGAGIVGLTTAISLQARGHTVHLIDRKHINDNVDSNNSGVLSFSVCPPLNVPSFREQFNQIRKQQIPGLHIELSQMAKNAHWLKQACVPSGDAGMRARYLSFKALLTRSLYLYEQTVNQTQSKLKLHKRGLLKVYRSISAFQDSEAQLDHYEHQGIRFDLVNKNEINELEPGLTPNVYKRGILLDGIAQLNHPTALMLQLTHQFLTSGGKYIEAECHGARQTADGWQIWCDDREKINGHELVVAIGGASKPLLADLGLKLPLAYFNAEYRDVKQGFGLPLSRPLYDAENAFLLTPYHKHVRLSTGVEMSQFNRFKKNTRLVDAEIKAREVMSISRPINSADWHGQFSALPDFLPLVGATKLPHLWLNTGHHVVGQSASFACAELISDLIDNKTPKVDTARFSPLKYRL